MTGRVECVVRRTLLILHINCAVDRHEGAYHARGQYEVITAVRTETADRD